MMSYLGINTMVVEIFRNRLKVNANLIGYLADSFRSNTRIGHFVNSTGHVSSLSGFQSPESTNVWSNISVTNTMVSKVFISSHNSTVQECWNCKKPKSSTLFCSHCNSLLPLDKRKNFFEMLGVSQTYKIQLSQLKKNYRDLQTLLHPDKFSTRPKREQVISEEFSSEVNKAYNTLLDPLERGLYLLRLDDISIEEGSTQIDKIFLMEIMERNEEIESEADPLKLSKFYSNNREQLENLISELGEAFDSRNLPLAKELLTKMKYYKSIEVKIKQIRQKLNIPD